MMKQFNLYILYLVTMFLISLFLFAGYLTGYNVIGFIVAFVCYGCNLVIVTLLCLNNWRTNDETISCRH